LIYLIRTTTTLFWLSSADCWKKDIIFLASLMMKISQSKRQLKCCFNKYIELTIYQASLYLIEILNSSSFFESLFVNDWAFLFNCSLSITLRSMIKANKSIRMSSDIFVSSVHTCRTTDSSDYSWLSLLTITSCLQSFSWFSSLWTRTFTLIWASTLTSLSMKALANVCRLLESKIYLITWIRHWSSLAKLWSKHENKWWIKLISIERKSIMRLNQRCFWTNKTLLQWDLSKNWMTRCSTHFRSLSLLTHSISWNYQRLCIYMTYFIQSFFVLLLMTLCLIKRMNLRNQ